MLEKMADFFENSGVCLASAEHSDADLYQDKHTPRSQIGFRVRFMGKKKRFYLLNLF